MNTKPINQRALAEFAVQNMQITLLFADVILRVAEGLKVSGNAEIARRLPNVEQLQASVELMRSCLSQARIEIGLD